MPEIKYRIVLATVLKPLNDPRMVGKVACSLRCISGAEVHCIGHSVSSGPVEVPGLVFHPLGRFGRLSISRLLAPWKVLVKILQIRPRVLIIATHELLFMAFLARVFIRCRVFYDVQENYYRNILHTNAFPPVIRHILAVYVRGRERVSTFFIDHFFLAERAYLHEMKFAGPNATLLENKVRKPLEIPVRGNRSRLVFTGTLAEGTGVFTAIELAVKLRVVDPEITLTIAGFCPENATAEKIRNTVEPMPFIRLIGLDHHVPHEIILSEIRQAGFGVIAYPVNPAVKNRIPTKLYEYLANQLPMLITDHPVWTALCAPYAAAIPFSPHAIHAREIHAKMRSRTFYTSQPENVFWEQEEPKLLSVVQKYLS